MHSAKRPSQFVEGCIRLDDTRNQSVLFKFMSTPSAGKKPRSSMCCSIRSTCAPESDVGSISIILPNLPGTLTGFV